MAGSGSSGSGHCGISPNPLDWFWCVIETISSLIQKMTAFILWLSGMILDFVVNYTIINMAEKVRNFTGINIAWKIIRDLMNITFIFLLVYEGIKLIIGLGSRDGIKRLIGGIVLASILINFSLFFTKILIDTSNIITIAFYNISINSGTGTAAVDGAPPNSPLSGLSVPFMNDLGLTDFANVAISADGGGMVIFYLLGAVVFLVTAFIFFAVACMLTIRYITLLFLLMLSPVAYMGMALPSMKGYASQWWESLRGQLIFAPVFMIMVLIILTLMGSAGFITRGAGDWGKVMSGDAVASQGALGLIFNFVVIVGLLIASLITAKSTASHGSKLIGQATGRLTTFAGGAIMGGAARIQRNTIGRVGANMANDEDLKERAETSFVARMQLAAANRAATSTFDVRTAPGIGGLAKTAGVDFGKVDAKKENFRAQMDARMKADTEKLKRYKPSDLSVEDAKQELASDEFKNAEEKRKRDRIAYLAKDEYLKSDEYQNREKLKKDKANLADMEQKLNDLKTNIANEDKGTREYFRMEEEISRMEGQARKNKKDLENTQSIVNGYESDVVDDSWISNERKRVIAMAGGTKKKDDKIVDANNVEVKQNVLSVYQQRVEAVAKRVEKTNPVWRYTANTLGTITSAVGITTPTPMTRNDRRELGRRMRKEAMGKSKAELLADAAREAQKEKDEQERTATGSATPNTPPPNAPPASPPPPPIT